MEEIDQPRPGFPTGARIRCRLPERSAMPPAAARLCVRMSFRCSAIETMEKAALLSERGLPLLPL